MTTKTKTAKQFKEITESAMSDVDMITLRNVALNLAITFFSNPEAIRRITSSNSLSTGLIISAATDFEKYLMEGKAPEISEETITNPEN